MKDNDLVVIIRIWSPYEDAIIGSYFFIEDLTSRVQNYNGYSDRIVGVEIVDVS